MTQWLYRLEPARPGLVTGPTEREQELVGAHFSYLVDLLERGQLILAGRTQEGDGSFGLAIFEAPDEDAARAVVDGDPAIAGGVFSASLHPYSIAVARGELGA